MAVAAAFRARRPLSAHAAPKLTNPPPTLRDLLVQVALAAVLPAALVMTALAVWPYLQERERAEEGLVVTARLLGSALDERLVQLERQLERIAQSIPLDDPGSFQASALRLRDAEQIDALILVRPDGVHELNTRFAQGEGLPRSSPAMLTGAIRRGVAVINDLSTAPVGEQPTVGVGIPVVDRGQIRYALNGAIETGRIRDLLLRQALPAGWAASVIDRNGYLIAHSLDHDLRVGSRAPAGDAEDDGGLLSASALSPVSGWTVRVEVPQRQLFAPMQRRLASVGIALVLLVGVILLAIRHFHATLLRAAEGLADFVRQTRHGEDVDPPALGVREIDQFARALKALDRHLLRTQVKLASTQRRLAGIVDTAVDAIVTIDEDQHIVMFNRAAQQVFGYRADEVIGKPVEMLLPERHRGGHRRAVREFGLKASGTRQMGGDRVVHARHASGTDFPVEASISAMVDEEGRRWMTVILRDATQRLREREALVRSNLELKRRLGEGESRAFCSDGMSEAEAADALALLQRALVTTRPVPLASSAHPVPHRDAS